MEDQKVECPICCDDLNVSGCNFIRTECGHMFHCSCLMQNTGHNGYSCPMCRTDMATFSDNNDSISEYSIYNPNDLTPDELLYAFREFHAEYTNNEQEDEDEDEDEDENEDEDNSLYEDNSLDEENKASLPSDLASLLVNARGKNKITEIELIKTIIHLSSTFVNKINMSDDTEIEFRKTAFKVCGQIMSRIVAIDRNNANS
jgi:hypothetical protein